MGATNPANAAEGTIRKDFLPSRSRPTRVHGSDSPENAAQEIAFFFSESPTKSARELHGRPARAATDARIRKSPIRARRITTVT